MSIDLTELQKFEWKDGRMYSLKQIRMLQARDAQKLTEIADVLETANEEETTKISDNLSRVDKIKILRDAGVQFNGKNINYNIPTEDLNAAYTNYIKELQNGK